MRRCTVFVLCFLACGSENRLNRRKECSTNSDCAVGSVCNLSSSVCEVAHGGDLNAWPAPHDSAELLDRFHRMALAPISGESPGTQHLLFTGNTPGDVTQNVVEAHLQAEVERPATGPTLLLWDLAASGVGGELQIWPLVTRGEPVSAPIQRLTLSLKEPKLLPLQLDAFPNAHASGQVTVQVTALVGVDAERTVALSTTLQDAALSVKFSVVDAHVQLELHLEGTSSGEGGDQWLRPERLQLDLLLRANEIPASWLIPAAGAL